MDCSARQCQQNGILNEGFASGKEIPVSISPCIFDTEMAQTGERDKHTLTEQ